MHCLLGAFVTIFLAHCLFAAHPLSPPSRARCAAALPPIACDYGLFCEKPAGTCNTPDLSGKCEVVPGACTRRCARRLCASLTQTASAKEYSNDCNRKMPGSP